MKCPFDDTHLKTVDRHNIEIDWCETCKGVWLERGELDKIIERVTYENSVERIDEAPRQRRPDWDDDDDDDDDRRPRDSREYRSSGRDWESISHDSRKNPKKKSKASFLSEMFEF